MALWGAALRAAIGSCIAAVLFICACAREVSARDIPVFGHAAWTPGTPAWYLQRLERMQPQDARHANGRQQQLLSGPIVAWTAGTPAWYRQRCEREAESGRMPALPLATWAPPQGRASHERVPRNASSGHGGGENSSENSSRRRAAVAIAADPDPDAVLLKWLESPAVRAAHWTLSATAVQDFTRFGAACPAGDTADDGTPVGSGNGSPSHSRSGLAKVLVLGPFESPLNTSAFSPVASASARSRQLGARQLFVVALVRRHALFPDPGALLLPLSGALPLWRAKGSGRLGRGFSVMLWLRRCHARQYEYLLSAGEWNSLFSIGLLAPYDAACPGGCVRVRAGGLTLHTVPSSAYSSGGNGRPAALPEPGKWCHLTVVLETREPPRGVRGALNSNTEAAASKATQTRRARATLRLYMNGRIASAKVDASEMKTQQPMPSSLDEMWAGGENVLGGRHYFRGNMRDIRVVRAALSPAMVAAAMRATTPSVRGGVDADSADTDAADAAQGPGYQITTASAPEPERATERKMTPQPESPLPNAAFELVRATEPKTAPQPEPQMPDITFEPTPPDRALLYYEKPLPRPKLGSRCVANDCDGVSKGDAESSWMLHARQSERAMRPAAGVPRCARFVRLSGQQSFLPQWSAMGVFEQLGAPGVVATTTGAWRRVYVQRWTRHAEQRGNGSVGAASGVAEAQWRQWPGAAWHCPVNGVMTRPKTAGQHILLRLRVHSESRSEIVSESTKKGRNIFWVAIRSAREDSLLAGENETSGADSAAFWPLRHDHPRILSGTVHRLAVLRARSDAQVPELVRPAAWQFWDSGNGTCELHHGDTASGSCETSAWGRVAKRRGGASGPRWASYTDVRVTCEDAGGDEHGALHAVATGRPQGGRAGAASVPNISVGEHAVPLTEPRSSNAGHSKRHRWRPTSLEHWKHRISRFYHQHNPSRASTATVTTVVENQLGDLREEMAWERARGADCGRHAWCSGRAAATGRGGNDTTAQAAGNATEKRDGAVRAFSERSMRRMRAVRELLASQYDEMLNNTAAEAVRIMYDRAAQVSHARRQAQSGVPVTNSEARSSAGSSSNSSGGRVGNGSTLRGCLIYYVSPDQSQKDGGGFERDAVRSMQCMFKHYVRHHGHRVLLFHTFGNATAERVRRRVPFVELHRVDVGYPPDVDEAYLGNGRCMLDGNDYHDADPLQRKCGCTCPDLGPGRSPNAVRCWPTNYLLMNNFFVHLLWRQPALQGCDYFMRVDADLFLQRPLHQDPMLVLHRGADPKHEDVPDTETQATGSGAEPSQQPRGRCSFTAEKENSDMAGCYEGQLQATRAWAEAAAARGVPGVYPSQLDNRKGGSVYWGGWHAGRTALFTSAAHLEYASWIMSVGGVFTRRWSDQTHYPLATALLTPRDEFCKQKAFGGECRTAGARGSTVCNASDPSEMFLHEHQLHTRVDVMERCLLDEEDLAFDNNATDDGSDHLAFY